MASKDEESVKAAAAQPGQRRHRSARLPRDPVYVERVATEFGATMARSAEVRTACDIVAITLSRDGRASLAVLMSALMGDPCWSANVDADVEQRFQARRHQRRREGHGQKLRAAWRDVIDDRFAIVAQLVVDPGGRGRR
jgi:hypothetical protein